TDHSRRLVVRGGIPDRRVVHGSSGPSRRREAGRGRAVARQDRRRAFPQSRVSRRPDRDRGEEKGSHGRLHHDERRDQKSRRHAGSHGRFCRGLENSRRRRLDDRRRVPADSAIAVIYAMADFLNLAGKTFLVLGVANKKSVAWFTAKTLEEQGATVLY